MIQYTVIFPRMMTKKKMAAREVPISPTRGTVYVYRADGKPMKKQ